jgi:hypothetical protein
MDHVIGANDIQERRPLPFKWEAGVSKVVHFRLPAESPER